MTFRDLLYELAKWPEQELDQSATVYCRQSDESFMVEGIRESSDEVNDPLAGVFDAGQKVLVIDF